MNTPRIVRIAATVLAAFGVLYLRFSSGAWEDNEVTPVIPWGMLPVAFLFGFGAWALEISKTGSTARRDALWGLSAAVGSYAVLRLLEIV